MRTALLWAMVALGVLSASSCRNGTTPLQDGSLPSEGLAFSDRATGDRPADGAPGDGPREDASPPAKPFGTWTSTCTATPYPNDTSNAYPTGFEQAVADDWTYIAWVWRLSPDAATNHSVSIMKSKDLKTWYNLCGAAVTLPVTPASKTVIDAVPTSAGLLNSRLALSFDASKRAVVTYQKNIDKKLPDGTVKSTTQVFNARLEGSVVKIYQLTNWNSLDSFGGGGSLPASDTSISFSGLKLSPSGVVAQTLNRSTADDDACKAVEAGGGACSAFPKDGTWEVQDSAAGLALRAPLTAVSGTTLASADPWESPPTAALPVGQVENAPLSSDPAAAAWQVRTRMSRAENRWITLRSDFRRRQQRGRAVRPA